MDHDAMISAHCRAIDVSGIRRVFELGAKLSDPINLSIGQPDFPVPDEIKEATIEAIRADRNGYTLTQGAPELLSAASAHLAEDVGWETPSDDLGLLVASGTSGALLLAFSALVNPGDEVILPDPFFVVYPAIGRITGAKLVYCDIYPDFRMTAERVEPLITERTKILVVNSPGNPSGVVLTNAELRELAELCERKGVILVSDEIYDAFTYSESRENGKCPSPARFTRQMILIRGMGKTYGCTGWRMAYAAGPKVIMQQMQKLQQYTFVCAPSMAQVGLAAAFGLDVSGHVDAYQRKRDMVVEAFEGVTDLVFPGGAFYAFPEIPSSLGLTPGQFAERAIERNVLTIPGNAFSAKDTHLRISYAVPDEKLRAGLDVLRDLFINPG
ncbi:MAG: aminotransferase class I/II-fold pyridoxal phosphate-dependent enzyme [Phycisphaerales bacterium]|nr:MAG: aminotransferase class I/II-fold pyridoxal phosphate-dependent enzyme [Phycisphaerales bacterium]